MTKYVAFMYLPQENVYTFKSMSTDLSSLLTTDSRTWTVVYSFVRDESIGVYVKSNRYEYHTIVKGSDVPSYISPNPMNYATYISVPLNYENSALTGKWYFNSF